MISWWLISINNDFDVVEPFSSRLYGMPYICNKQDKWKLIIMIMYLFLHCVCMVREKIESVRIIWTWWTVTSEMGCHIILTTQQNQKYHNSSRHAKCLVENSLTICRTSLQPQVCLKGFGKKCKKKWKIRKGRKS